MPPLLRAISGPYAGQSFPLAEGSAVIGREPDCGICLTADTGVSRRHVQLDFQGQRLVVHDLGSSNGVFLNGARTVSTIVQPGDRLHVGNTVFEIIDEPPPAPAGPSALAAQPLLMPAAPYTSPLPTPAGGGYPPPDQGAAPAPGYVPPPVGYAPPGTGSALVPGAPIAGAPYGSAPPSRSVPYAWALYFLGFSFPPVGIVLAVIYWLKDTPEEQRVGKALMAWSVVGLLLGWLCYLEIMSVWHQYAPMLQGGNMNGLLGGGDSASSTLNQAVPSSFTRSLPGLRTP